MWLKKAPVNLFSLALLIVVLYFTIFATNPYAIGAFIFLLLASLSIIGRTQYLLSLFAL